MSDYRSLPVVQYPPNAMAQGFNQSQQSQLAQQAMQGGHQLEQALANQRMQTDQSAFDTGMIAGLRRELAQAKETAAVAMRVAATKQQTIDTLEKDIATLEDQAAPTIDTQRALIEELTAERDAWQQCAREQRAVADQAAEVVANWQRIAEHERSLATHAEPPTFPASARALSDTDQFFRENLSVLRRLALESRSRGDIAYAKKIEDLADRMEATICSMAPASGDREQRPAFPASALRCGQWKPVV